MSAVSTVPEMSEVPDVSNESGLTSVSCVWDLLGVSGKCLVLEVFLMCFICHVCLICHLITLVSKFLMAKSIL